MHVGGTGDDNSGNFPGQYMPLIDNWREVRKKVEVGGSGWDSLSCSSGARHHDRGGEGDETEGEGEMEGK